MSHAEIGVQNDAIHAIIAAAQQLLIEHAQSVCHGSLTQGDAEHQRLSDMNKPTRASRCPVVLDFDAGELPHRGHFSAAVSGEKRRISYQEKPEPGRCPMSSPTGVGPMMNGSFNRSFFCGQIASGRDQPLVEQGMVEVDGAAGSVEEVSVSSGSRL